MQAFFIFICKYCVKMSYFWDILLFTIRLFYVKIIIEKL